MLTSKQCFSSALLATYTPDTFCYSLTNKPKMLRTVVSYTCAIPTSISIGKKMLCVDRRGFSSTYACTYAGEPALRSAVYQNPEYRSFFQKPRNPCSYSILANDKVLYSARLISVSSRKELIKYSGCQNDDQSHFKELQFMKPLLLLSPFS